MGDREYIAKLKEENGELLAENEALRASLKPPIPLPKEWPLSPSEATIFRVLSKHKIATRNMLMAALFFDRPDPPENKIIDVHIHRIRRKLGAHGVTITLAKGAGWMLDAETRARLSTLTPSAGKPGFEEEAR